MCSHREAVSKIFRDKALYRKEKKSKRRKKEESRFERRLGSRFDQPSELFAMILKMRILLKLPTVT